jgi:hypothetical protein
MTLPLVIPVIVGIAASVAHAAVTSVGDPPSSPRLLELESKIQAASATSEEWLEAACLVAQLGAIPRSQIYVKGALAAGFDDVHRLYHEPDLAPLRDHGAITAVREEAAIAAADRAIATWKTTFGESEYIFERDERTGITWISSLTKEEHGHAKEAIAAELSCLQGTLFPKISPLGLVIAIPTHRHAAVLLEGRDDVGGIYLPDQNRLIARSAGTNLQHEFVHAVHHEQMARLGQIHAAWVQEGLASLMEAYSCGSGSTLVITPNDRDEIVAVRVRGAGMPPLKTTARLDVERFSRGTARRLRYAQARSVMTYLLSLGLLDRWYQEYTRGFDDDPTGLAAMADVTGQDTRSFERSWRQWILDRDPPADGGG